MTIKQLRGIHSFRPGEALRIEEWHKPGDRFFIFTSIKRAIILTLTDDRRLIDEAGHYFACEDVRLMTDTIDRAGVGPFSLPIEDAFTRVAKYHDYRYSCAEYQLTNLRNEADLILFDNMIAVSESFPRRVLAAACYGIVNALGWIWWDKKGKK